MQTGEYFETNENEHKSTVPSSEYFETEDEDKTDKVLAQVKTLVPKLTAPVPKLDKNDEIEILPSPSPSPSSFAIETVNKKHEAIKNLIIFNKKLVKSLSQKSNLYTNLTYPSANYEKTNLSSTKPYVNLTNYKKKKTKLSSTSTTPKKQSIHDPTKPMFIGKEIFYCRNRQTFVHIDNL